MAGPKANDRLSVEAVEKLPFRIDSLRTFATSGGATTLATASDAHFGFESSIPMIAGIALGLASIAAASAIGLAKPPPFGSGLQIVIKAVGSIYLVWLAWRLARNCAPGARHDTS